MMARAVAGLATALLSGCSSASSAVDGQASTPQLSTESSRSPAAAPAEPPWVEAGERTSRVVLTGPGGSPVVVEVEVVHDDDGRSRGLMFRKKLASNTGMLFVFEREEQLSFWMKNTYVPLDMIFIKSDLTVLGAVENAEPLTLSSRRVAGDSQFVLEVNAGFAGRNRIEPGAVVRFENLPDMPFYSPEGK